MIGAYMKCTEMYGNGVRIIGISTRQSKLLIPRARNLALTVFCAAARGFRHGRNVRSAYRHDISPAYRLDIIGFRLARGHELKSVRQVQSSPAASSDSLVAEQRQSGLVAGLRKLLGK